MRLVLIDIIDGEDATGEKLAGHCVDILSDRASVNPADNRYIIGTVDGDGNKLAGSAV